MTVLQGFAVVIAGFAVIGVALTLCAVVVGATADQDDT